MVADTKSLEDVLVLVVNLEGVLEVLESLVVVSGVLRDVDEIEEGAECEHEIMRYAPDETAQQNAGHVFALAPGHLGERRDTVLEVPRTVCRRETAYTLIELLLIHRLRTPLQDVLEDTLV